MENASKALIMAAEIILGILILVIIILGYHSWSNFSKNINQNINQTRINEFNSKFLGYNGRTDLTAHDVVTIVNLANDYNIDSETGEEKDAGYKINVNITGASGNATMNGIKNNNIQFITKNEYKRFSMTNIDYDQKTGIVKTINIRGQ